MKLNTAKIDILLAKKIWTKTMLAEKCGVARQNISSVLVRGICEPKTAGKIAAALEVDVESIIISDPQ